MRWTASALAAILLTGAPVLAQEKKDPTPAEKAALRQAQLLLPGIGSTQVNKGPLPRRPTAWIENPEVPLPIFQGSPPHLQQIPIKKETAPHPPEEAPLVSFRDQPPTPYAVELATGYLVRLLTSDVNQPLPLPMLATPQKDRASLSDPTYDTSLAVALAQVEAVRLLPVPFMPINLPDPFENSQAVRLRFLFEEDATPATVTPRPPPRK